MEPKEYLEKLEGINNKLINDLSIISLTTVKVAAMNAANLERDRKGEAPAYGEDMFIALAEELNLALGRREKKEVVQSVAVPVPTGGIFHHTDIVQAMTEGRILMVKIEPGQEEHKKLDLKCKVFADVKSCGLNATVINFDGSEEKHEM